MTVVIIVACFLSLMAVQAVGFQVGKTWATKHGTKAIAAPSGFKCPYCRVDVVGVRDLDLINHSLCITRSEEDLDKLRAEAKKAPPKDEYFVDARSYTYSRMSQVPAKWQGTAYLNNNIDYQVDEAKVYRNGECIKEVYGRGKRAAEEFAQREIVIDKHKRQKA